jgi:hypothetical protein
MHRKYARNNKNFMDLDELLKELRPPLLSESGDAEYQKDSVSRRLKPRPLKKRVLSYNWCA